MFLNSFKDWIITLMVEVQAFTENIVQDPFLVFQYCYRRINLFQSDPTDQMQNNP